MKHTTREGHGGMLTAGNGRRTRRQTHNQTKANAHESDGQETEMHGESNAYSARALSALFLPQRTQPSSVSSAARPCQIGASCSPSDVLGPTWVNHPTDPRKPRTVSILNITPDRAARQAAPHLSPWPDMGEPPDRPEETSDCLSHQPFI